MDIWMDGRMYGWADGRTEFLPILQDFVPSRGCCPATLYNFTASKKQGKGIADVMMPFGVLSLCKNILSGSKPCKEIETGATKN